MSLDSMDTYDKHGRIREAHSEVPFGEKDRISQIASMARELGLSYGQLQAMNYEKLLNLQEEERRAEIVRKEKNAKIALGYRECRSCGVMFLPTNKNQRFCSISCSKRREARK